MEAEPFNGTWSYRSFVNDPDLDTEFNDLRFGAGSLTLHSPSFGHLVGTLGGTGWELTLNGAVSYGNPFACRFQGVGEIGGETWVYDYNGYLTPVWPHGVNQIPAITGSVSRTVAHPNGQATAGLSRPSSPCGRRRDGGPGLACRAISPKCGDARPIATSLAKPLRPNASGQN